MGGMKNKTSTTTAAVSVAGLRKSFGDTVVLDGIDLNVPAGTIFSLLGPNGAGTVRSMPSSTTVSPNDLRSPVADTAAVAADCWFFMPPMLRP